MTTPSADPSSTLPNLGRVVPLLARTVVAIVVIAFLVTEIVQILVFAPPDSQLLEIWSAAGAIFAVQLLHCTRRMRTGRWHHVGWLSIPVLAAACYLPLLDFGAFWNALGCFVVASVLLMIPIPAVAWTVVAAIATATAWVSAGHFSAVDTLFVTLLNVLTGVVIYAITRFADLIADVHEARRELARLAVERERGRFARDLHDLLGYSLSAIALKAELAHRLLHVDLARTRDEIAAVLSVSRQALDDVRAVSRRYRDMSLAAQAKSAEAMLSSAGVEVTAHVADLDLPPRVDTVLATTLREAVTNMLRHSVASRCTIALRRETDRVTLMISNNGVTVDDDTHGGHSFGDGAGGLGNLSTRLAGVDGTLRTRIDEHGAFELVASAPVSRGRTPIRSVTDGNRVRSDLLDLDAPASATGRFTVAAVVLGYLVIQFIHVLDLHPSGASRTTAIVVLPVVLVLTLLHSSNTFRTGPWRHATWLTVPALAAATYVPLYEFGVGWASVGCFTIATVLLVVRPAVVGAVIVAGIGVAIAVVAAQQPGYTYADVTYLVVSNVLTGFVIFSVARFADLIAEVHSARQELARFAVEKERTRFSRDLHDLLGYSVSAVTLKSELALRLVDADPTQAESDLVAVINIARQALVDVRSVARSYREMSLTVQAASAVSMLESAGIAVESDLGEPSLPGPVDTVFATTVREAVTNLLRHSKAERCRIRLAADGGTATLTIANDGIDAVTLGAGSGEHDAPFGDGRGGLSNLGSRLAAVDGQLDARVTDDGWFEISACAPLRRQARV